jgi:hypothetical protein
MSDWVTLAPRLHPNGRGLRYFVKFIKELAKPGYERLALDKLREEYLDHSADTREEDRKPLRVLVAVLCDLKSKGWRFKCKEGIVSVAGPEDLGGSILEQKDRVRSSLLVERDSQLRLAAVRAFVKGMEQRRLGTKDWSSIFSVMRDGRELADKLRLARAKPNGPERVAALRKVIDPYLQVVDGDATCKETGLKLAEIWRYFRHTWATPYTNAPGRKFWLLIRDRAAKNHPVIGIASFGNAVVQLTPRDEWIGWTAPKFLATLKAEPSRDWAIWLQTSVEEMASAIYSDDFVKQKVVTRKELRKPTDEVIDRLLKLMVEERRLHDLNPQADLHKESKTQDIDWMTRANTHLFRAKRAEALSRILKVRKALIEVGFVEATKDGLQRVLESGVGRRAVEMVLRSVKATRVGISMMEITICGAVAPYRSILGGKLVAMLLTSSEVVQEYQRRYGNACSVIASSMAGKAVQRKPNLVALGTTSLYGAGSAMYNRISIPAEAVGGAAGDVVKYADLGKSMGFGSIQFSPDTINEIEAIVQGKDGGRQINHIFGEGVSPRLRKVRQGMELAGLPPDKLLKHGAPRIVYGVALAEQFREVLMGKRKNRPRYFFPFENPAEVTSLIADCWISRWLCNRIENDDVLAEVAGNTLVYPISHGARVDLPVMQEDELTLFAGLELVS